MSGKAPES